MDQIEYDLEKEFEIHLKPNPHNDSHALNEQLSILKNYAEDCDHITEIGVNIGHSTRGFMAGKPKKMIGIDIKHFGAATKRLEDLASHNGIKYEYRVADSMSVVIEPTDLLFLDGNHSYRYVLGELLMHAAKVKKWIFLHDINHEGKPSPVGEPYAVIEGTNDFLKTTNNWVIKLVDKRQVGLMVLERIKEENINE